MYKILSAIILLILTCANIQAQDNYLSGYYTDANGVKETGFLLIEDSSETPQDFLFKKNVDDEAITITKKKATSYTIETSEELRKFVLKPILTYSSNNKFEQLDNEREVGFKQEELFIEVLVQSNSSLYKLKRDDESDLFFHSESDDKITTLVMKRYRGYQNQIKTNNSFKQQLSSTLRCNDNTQLNFDVIEYNENSLTKIFQSFIKCSNSNSNFVKQEEKEKLFNIKASVGAGFASFEADTREGNVDFDESNYISFGGEIEYLFGNKKWGLILNVTTYDFSNVDSNEVPGIFPSTETIIVENGAEVSGVDLNIGARHYFNINDDSAFFLGAFFGIDLVNNTEIKFLDLNRETITSSQGAPNFAIAAGYKWKKLSAEFKLHTAKNHLSEGSFFNDSELNYSSISLRYELFSF